MGAAGCHSRVVTDGVGTPLATAGPTGYSPAQFHSAYELPTGAPTAQTIAIVDAYDNPTIESDLAVFDSTFGLPACTTANGCFVKVNQSGQAGPYPKLNAGWALEIALDVEAAHAICQNCKILLVEASSNLFSDLTAAVKTAAAMGATQISNSYGGPEYSEEKTDLSYKYPGIAITASAGDGGYRAEYPAASPYVVAVGGTTLSLGASSSYGSESVWSGSGSGCSAYLSAQSWQTSDPHWGPTACGTKRGIADVAADADPATGASIYDTTKLEGQSGWFKVGGTSLSAPLIAAVYALAGGSSADYPAADPYGHQADSPASLHDVTAGSNGSCGGTTMCKGAVGYDGPTGVGTPKGIAAFGIGGPDTTPPETTIDSGPSGPTNDSTPTFTFSSNEANSTFKCRIDAASFTACTSPYTAAPALGDGAHSFEVFAIDKADNADLSPAARTFSVDTAAPQVDLTSPGAGSISGSATPTLSGTAGTASGDSATVTIKIYSGTGTGGTLLQTRSASRDPSTGAYSVAATTLASGTYTAQASQADSAANTGLSPARTFSVDTVAPASQASSPANSNSTSLTVAYTASDANAGLATVELWAKPAGAGSYEKVATDSSPVASGSFPYTAAAGDGTYSFYTRATDKAGNYEAAPGTADTTTLLDTTPPQTTIDSGPSGPTNDSTPTFAFSSSEANSTFKCRVDAASFSACTSPYTAAPALGDGAHSFEVFAVDKAANADSSPAARAFSIDTVAPTSQASAPANSNSTSITVAYTASDANAGLATVELWVKPPGAPSYEKVATDSSPVASGSFPYTAVAGDGTYSFYTRATDKAGNYEAAPGTADTTTVIDTTPPQTTIDSGLSGPTNDSTPTFTFSSSESGSTFKCRIDAASFTACTSPYTAAPALGDGAHSFEVFATDKATNADSSPAARAFSVDTVAPASQASSPANSNFTSITVAYTASDANSGLATVELWAKPPGAGSYEKVATDSSPGASGSFPYTAAAGDGTYSFYTRATDKAGNYEAAPGTADTTTVIDTGEADPQVPPDPVVSPPPPSTTVPPEATLLPPTILSTAPSATPFRLGRVERVDGGKAAILTVRVPGPGTLVLFGRKVKRATRKPDAAGATTLPVRLKKRFAHFAGTARVYVTFSSADGGTITRSTEIPFG